MKIVICGYYGMGNIGDEAILNGLKLTLSKIWPNSECVVLGRGKLLPIGIRSFLKALFKPNLFLEPFNLIKSSDVFILGGGGLFTDEENLFVSSFWALHGFFALMLKKPVLVLGVSAGKMYFFNKWIVKFVLKRAELVMVRDKASQKIFEGMGIKSYLGCDFATVIANKVKQSTIDTNDNDDNYIVISMRKFKNTDANLYKIFAQFCDEVIEKFGLTIKLIPFQKGEENDVQVLRKIFEQVKYKEQVFLENFYEDINELMQVLANAKIVIGMRLHAGILSALAGTPFIPITYMDKVSDFWEDYAEIKSLQIDKISLDELLKRFQNIYSTERQHREITKKISEDLGKKAEDTMSFLHKQESIRGTDPHFRGDDINETI